MSTVVTVSITGCSPQAGGVGIDLTQQNIILEIRPDTAAARALAAGGAHLQVGDRVLSVDGTALRGRVLTEVIQPGDNHDFEVERKQGFSGFSIEEDADEDGFGQLDRLRTVLVQKVDGQLGINPEVQVPDGASAIIKIAKVFPNTRASASGVVSVGDVMHSINGQPLACGVDENPLGAAMKVLGEVPNGEDITIELESDTLMAGFMSKKGEKGFLGAKSAWQRRFMVLVWSETSMAEREIRYFDGQDYNSRKQKGAIDLTRATSVSHREFEGQHGLVIETPGRAWELLPEGREAAVEWLRLLAHLLHRKKGLAVVSSMSNAVEEAAAGLDGDAATPGELTLKLHRKLGMSINKLGNEIVVAELEPDGAAAACGLLSIGDALDEVNGVKTEGCKQTIKLLTANPSAAQIKVFSKVVHGGWMHKLGEGLGGWTTRYFTLTYELDPSAAPKGAGNTGRIADKLDAKRERTRAASIAVSGSSQVMVHLHKTNRTDKLGVSLAEDDEGRVVLQRTYDGYIAANSGSLRVGDVLVAVNGENVHTQPAAHKLLSDAVGGVELQVLRQQESGCWMLRYYDAKNSAARVEKGCIALSKGTVREINRYTLQDEDESGGGDVPRVGMYILQDERCWELLPPEEELEMWISKLQMACFGQEVIAAEYATAEKAAAAAQKVSDLKGAHYLTLQQQYGLMLATYKDDKPGGQVQTTFSDRPNANVYILSLEMDGAGACSGMLAPDDRVLEVDGKRAESLQQVTTIFRESRENVRIKVASQVVCGGFLYKKGEMNTTLQLRWFLLTDDTNGGGSTLRYYEGRNVVSRTLKGEIRITPQDVSLVRTFTHEGQGEKRLGVRITTSSRAWELVAHRSDAEARHWAELLNARIRKRVHRPTMAQAIDVTDVQQAAAAGSKEAGIAPQVTRL